MDAHDELFYRLNDPDPHTQAMAELDLLDEIFGGNFVERWLKWNGFEVALRDELAGVSSGLGAGLVWIRHGRYEPLSRRSARQAFSSVRARDSYCLADSSTRHA